VQWPKASSILFLGLLLASALFGLGCFGKRLVDRVWVKLDDLLLLAKSLCGVLSRWPLMNMDGTV